MGFLRNTIALAFVATLLFYFVTVGQMEENQQWMTIGVMVALGLIFGCQTANSVTQRAIDWVQGPFGNDLDSKTDSFDGS